MRVCPLHLTVGGPMRQTIRLAVSTLALALASTGALALGDKRDKGEPNTRTSTSASTPAQGTDKSTQGGQGSTTTADPGKTADQSLKQQHDQQGGTTNPDRGRVPG